MRAENPKRISKEVKRKRNLIRGMGNRVWIKDRIENHIARRRDKKGNGKKHPNSEKEEKENSSDWTHYYVERYFGVCARCWILMDQNQDLTQEQRDKTEDWRRVDLILGCETKMIFFVPNCSADLLEAMYKREKDDLPQTRCLPAHRLELWDKERKTSVPIWGARSRRLLAEYHEKSCS